MSFSYLFWLCVWALIACAGGGHAREGKECNSIGNILKARGFTYPWWDTTSSSVTTDFSHVCPNIPNPSSKATKCCTTSFDTTLQRKEMSLAMERWLGDKLAAAADIFRERKSKFDITFKSLLARAHTSFHAMFERTYGMLYIQHAHVFHALFTTLEKYYDDGREPLETKLNEFFSILTRKMFEVLNAQYEFNDAYLSCAAIAIGKKQGLDLHRQIVSSLRRSFVATKALAQGLQDSDKILTNLKKLHITSESCLLPMSQMLHCPVCTEQRAFKPCTKFCTSITSTCLATTASLSKPWTEFVNALEGIIDRLLGPYNVEAVVEPIHIKISEAIMNFQESGPDLSQAVFSDCGKPKLRSRNKREASPKPANPFLNDDASGNPNAEVQPSKSLEKLLRETKNRVKKSRTLWDALPRQVCNAISKDYSSQLCWNGTATMKPEKTKKNEDLGEPVNTSTSKLESSTLVDEQIQHLLLITEKLKQAFNGMDVQWTPADEDDDFGSGMGSGSGDVPTDLEEGDDDDPSGQITGKGTPPIERRPINPFRNEKKKVRPPIHHISEDVNENRPPQRPNTPTRFDDYDVEEDDDDRDNIANKNPKQTIDIKGDHDGGIDFDVFVPPTPEPPPKIPPPTTPGRQIPTTTIRHSTDSNNNPSRGVVGGKTDNTAGKTVAILKLFSPVVSSILEKLFKFS